MFGLHAGSPICDAVPFFGAVSIDRDFDAQPPKQEALDLGLCQAAPVLDAGPDMLGQASKSKILYMYKYAHIIVDKNMYVYIYGIYI